MGNLTLAEINTAIATTLTFPDVITQDADELTDSIKATPTLQVYFEHIEDNTPSVNRTTFGADPLRVRLIRFNVDVLVTEAKDIAADMAAVYELADLVADKLDAQNAKPLFGLAGLQQFSWSADRVSFTYAGTVYRGIRFFMSLWVY